MVKKALIPHDETRTCIDERRVAALVQSQPPAAPCRICRYSGEHANRLAVDRRRCARGGNDLFRDGRSRARVYRLNCAGGDFRRFVLSRDQSLGEPRGEQAHGGAQKNLFCDRDTDSA